MLRNQKSAEEFRKSHEMIADSKLDFMGATIIADSRTVLTYGNGKDGAVQVAVDTYAGKVEHFEYEQKAGGDHYKTYGGKAPDWDDVVIRLIGSAGRFR